MHSYRVYCLDRLGKISSASWIEAETLEAAVEQVGAMHSGMNKEIWDGAECLAKVPAAKSLQPLDPAIGTFAKQQRFSSPAT